MEGLSGREIVEALGNSEPFLEFQELLSRVAPVDRPVLLLGERGTGKELAAHRLHYLSKRWDGPFVTLNCSTLSPSLIESELFGYEKGAFTGAEGSRAGRFETANTGTLFLDEIGTIPMEAQEKILRVVEYNSFERVGSSRSIEVDVRIVCATNADLKAMADRGEFKRDLLDRLSFEVLFLPPLRVRTGDIMLLANHFGTRMSYELGRDEDVRFSKQAVQELENYDWQGNVRELKNVVERAVYRADSSRIDSIEFDPFKPPYPFKTVFPEKSSEGKKEREEAAPIFKLQSFNKAVEQLEVELIAGALAQSRYNQKRAADLLDLTYDQFRGLYRKYREKLIGDKDSLPG